MRNPSKLEAFKIIGVRTKAKKYSSTPTRFSSLQHFLGGAEIEEINSPPTPLPIDSNEHLEAKFRSGVNRTDIPRMWGYPKVERRIANRQLFIENDIISWRRNKGEPL